MKSYATPDFWERYSALPSPVKRRARIVYSLWIEDPRHPSLHFKKVDELWSVRITDDYRALGLLEDDTLYWIWIGPHDDYDRLLAR